MRFSSSSLLLPPIFVMFADRSHGESVAVTWESPLGGETFTSGEYIVVKWCSTPSIMSPSFTLCTSHDEVDAKHFIFAQTDDDCGSTVWPTVEKTGDCSSVALTAPSVTSDTEYFLWMVDASGTRSRTPTFAIHQRQVTEETAEIQRLAEPIDAPQHHLRSSVQRLEADTPYTLTATSSSVSGSAPSSPHTITRRAQPPNKVAIAVPLAILGAVIIIVLVILLFRYFRKHQGMHASDPEKQKSDLGQAERNLSGSLQDCTGNFSSNDLSDVRPTPLWLISVDTSQEPYHVSRRIFSASLHAATIRSANTSRSSLPQSSSILTPSSSYIPPTTRASRQSLDIVSDSITSEDVPGIVNSTLAPPDTNIRGTSLSVDEENGTDLSLPGSPRLHRESMQHDAGFESVPI